eukprot:TRINITY_DN32201_c0_g1_i1.p1 TRINITY_DN32201_c0_g1~~TRINITY_DN32201_c0_g1_i1.p1  ORF type:complete len:144 (-),score=18.71 TRINITY_DN32201_c0_g1_i1:649-1080(-)
MTEGLAEVAMSGTGQIQTPLHVRFGDIVIVDITPRTGTPIGTPKDHFLVYQVVEPGSNVDDEEETEQQTLFEAYNRFDVATTRSRSLHPRSEKNVVLDMAASSLFMRRSSGKPFSDEQQTVLCAFSSGTCELDGSVAVGFSFK